MQQKLLGQQDDISNFHKQHLGSCHNVSKLLQHSMHTSQQVNCLVNQETQQTLSISLTQQQGSQSQVYCHASQLHMHQAHFQLKLGSQSSSSVQRGINSRVQALSPFQTQYTIEHQKQLFQFPRTSSEASSTSGTMALNEQTKVVDKCDVVFRKISFMKDTYVPILMEMYKKLTISLKNSPAQTLNPEQLNKYQKFKLWLENIFRILNRSPSTITADLTVEKLVCIEKAIIDVIKYQKSRNNAISEQQGRQQLQPSAAQSLQSQISKQQGTENQLNNMMQAKNLRTSVTATQSNAVVRLPSQYTQSNYVRTLQTSSGLEAITGNPINPLQQGSVGSLEKIHINAAQRVQINVSSQNDMNKLQVKTDPHQNSSALQPQLLKQQFHQRQSSHQLIQQQQVEQKIQQQKLQQSARALSSQITQPYQMNKVSDMQEKKSMSVKSEIFLEDQTTSPHTSQHPQTDQQRMISVSQSKSGTAQMASYSKSSFSPSICLVSSSNPSDHEKQTSSMPYQSNVETGMHMQADTLGTQSESPVTRTPGISTPTLSSEIASPDNTQHITSTLFPRQTCETEKPFERLSRVVKSMSDKALRAGVSEMYSVVRMVDGMSGSPPCNNSKAPLAEDLVDAVKGHIRADNILPEDSIVTTKKFKTYSIGMPLTVVSRNVSENLSLKLSNGMEASDLESMASSRSSRVEVNHALLKEISEINRQLICTRLDIIDEDSNLMSTGLETSKGTILKCSFTAITPEQDQTLPVLAMHMIVSSNYPNCSPALLNEPPLESSSKENGDLLVKAKSEFSRYLRCISQPMSLKEMARSWATCAHAVILEYCERKGGGNFSSQYGTWKTVSNS